MVVVHLTRHLHVEHPPNHVERVVIAQRGSNFAGGPGPIVAVVAEREVRVLGGEEDTSLAVRQHLEHPVHDPRRDFLEQRCAERGVRIQV